MNEPERAEFERLVGVANREIGQVARTHLQIFQDFVNACAKKTYDNTEEEKIILTSRFLLLKHSHDQN